MTFPVLVIDGEAFTDSTEIIAALEQRFAEPRLLPADPAERERALAIEEFFDDRARSLLASARLPRPAQRARRVRATSRPRCSRDRCSATRRAGRSEGGSVAPTRSCDTGLPARTRRSRPGARCSPPSTASRRSSRRGDGTYMVGGRFSVADLTAAALFAPVVQPPQGPETTMTLPAAFEEFRATLAGGPGTGGSRRRSRASAGTRAGPERFRTAALLSSLREVTMTSAGPAAARHGGAAAPDPPAPLGGGSIGREDLLAAPLRPRIARSRLERPLTDLRGVGAKLAESAARIGLRTLGDLIDHYPHDWIDRSAVTAIAELVPGRPATLLAEVRKPRLRPTRRRNLRIVEATVADGTGSIDVDLVQPGMAGRQAEARRPRAAQRTARRSQLPSRRVRDPRRLGGAGGGSRPDPRRAGACRRASTRPGSSRSIPAARACGSSGSANGSGRRCRWRRRCSSRCRPSCAPAIGSRAPPTPGSRSTSRVTATSSDRRGPGSPTRSCSCTRRRCRSAAASVAAACRRAALDAAGRPRRGLARGASVRADRRSAPGLRRDRRRSRRDPADAAAADGGGRLGQDGGRPLRDAAGARVGPAGGADGADRDPRRAALRDARSPARRPADADRAADRLDPGGPAPRHARPARDRRAAAARRDPCADRADRAFRPPRRRGRRRAAPLRRRAAPRARRQGRGGAARPPHDRDADPADAVADRLRRPRRHRSARASRRPPADPAPGSSARSGARAPTGSSATGFARAGRRTSSARSSATPRRIRPRRRRARPSASPAASSATSTSRSCTGRCPPRRRPGRWPASPTGPPTCSSPPA